MRPILESHMTFAQKWVAPSLLVLAAVAGIVAISSERRTIFYVALTLGFGLGALVAADSSRAHD